MNKVERNHYFFLIKSFSRGLSTSILGMVGIFAFFIDKIGAFYSFLLGLSFVFCLISYDIISWRKTFFYLEEKSIYLQNGVFTINKMEIPFENISTIDLSQTLFDRIFDTCTIKLDTGAAKTKGSELKFLLHKKRAEEVQSLLIENGNEKNKRKEVLSEEMEKLKPIYRFSLKEIFLYSILSNSLLQGMGILFCVYQFIDDYIKKFTNLNFLKYLQGIQIQNLYNQIFIIGSLIFILVFTLVFLSLSVGIAYNIFKYYDFKINFTEKNLRISYGLASTKKYNFETKRIKGIHICQSVLMQLTGFATIEIEVMGYGDEKEEKAILYPLCRESAIEGIVKEICPDFWFEGEKYMSSRESYFGFQYKGLLIWAALTFLAVLFYPLALYGSPVLFIFFLLQGHLKYKNAALGMNETLLYLCYNGFQKRQTIVKFKTVQSLTFSSSYFQEKREVYTYTISMYGSIYGKEISVKHITNKIAAKIYGYFKDLHSAP